MHEMSQNNLEILTQFYNTVTYNYRIHTISIKSNKVK